MLILLLVQAACKDTAKGSTWLIKLHAVDPSVGTLGPFSALATGDLLPAATATGLNVRSHSRDSSSRGSGSSQNKGPEGSDHGKNRQRRHSPEDHGHRGGSDHEEHRHGHKGAANRDEHRQRHGKGLESDNEDRSPTSDLHGRLNSRYVLTTAVGASWWDKLVMFAFHFCKAAL